MSGQLVIRIFSDGPIGRRSLPFEFCEQALPCDLDGKLLNPVEPGDDAPTKLVRRLSGEVVRVSESILTPKQREVLRLLHVEGWKESQVACMLRVARKTVWKHRDSAYRRLRKAVDADPILKRCKRLWHQATT